MAKVCITETVLRDAHQCLIATRMRTDDMLAIADKLDAVGFWSLEAWGGATFDACVRFLKEDPFERLRKLKKALPNTPLQMLLRGQNLLGYRHYADDVVAAFVECAATNGVDVFRVFDALNDLRNMQTAIAAVKKNNKHAQGAIAYTVSPVHTLDKFVDMGVELQKMGCDSIAIKDMAGLLTPTVTQQLVPALLSVLQVPLHIHSHATSGLADLCQWEAVKAGCLHIDTAISTFAQGASHPCTESMVAAFKDTAYDSQLDLQLLQEIAVYFAAVRKKYAYFESDGTGVDTRVQVNQIPGGMISNLYNQLKEQNALDKIAAVQAEIPRVRKDLGYPPLVTPTSQMVGTQAVLNVLTGKRYGTITNEVKHYLIGGYGQPPGDINETVRQQAVGNSELITQRPADLLSNELDTLQQEIGTLASSKEDLLIYAMFPDIGKQFLQQRHDGTLQPESLNIASTLDSKLSNQVVPSKFTITVHGERYQVDVTGAGHKQARQRPFYATVDGLPVEVLVDVAQNEQAEGETDTAPAANKKAKHPGDVCCTMPGSVVAIMVGVGDKVQAGDAVLAIEAMKMETEIQAPISGKVQAVHVSKGQRVNPDEALIEISEE